MQPKTLLPLNVGDGYSIALVLFLFFCYHGFEKYIKIYPGVERITLILVFEMTLNYLKSCI